VSGRRRQRSFATRVGKKRSGVEVQVDEIGVSLRYATVAVTKTPAMASARNLSLNANL
jgi:single-strand DNA-binding protein